MSLLSQFVEVPERKGKARREFVCGRREELKERVNEEVGRERDVGKTETEEDTETIGDPSVTSSVT